MRAERTPAISAHRGGHEKAAAGTYAAYEFALAAGADYLELDARQTGDGTLVACHRARLGWGRPVAGLAYAELCRLAGYEVPRIAQVLPLLAGRAGLHLDVKDSDSAAQAADLALGSLGPGGVVLTTREPAVGRRLARQFPDLKIGLAVGGDLVESARFLARRAVHPGLSRLDPVAAAGASWAALHYRQAEAGLATQCRERGIRTLVWTVNTDRALTRWLACPDVDVLVTDRPARAVAVRDQPASQVAGPDRAARPGPPDGRSGPAPGPVR
jgi:glycerophosphoryl diester phosphodiesterase